MGDDPSPEEAQRHDVLSESHSPRLEQKKRKKLDLFNCLKSLNRKEILSHVDMELKRVYIGKRGVPVLSILSCLNY